MKEGEKGSAGRDARTWEMAVRWLKDQPEKRDLVESAYYDDPLLASATRYWRSEEWTAVRSWLPAGRGGALDVGAGRGIASYALARDGYQVTALEPDGSSLVGAQAIRELAQESGLPIEVLQGVSEQMPLEDRKYDVIFSRAVLHHTRNLKSTLMECYRVLKPGGIMIAIREHVITRPEDLASFLDSHPLHRLYGGEHAYQLSEYVNAIMSAGFQLKAILSPFETPMNFAPHSLGSLQAELARRISTHMPGAQFLLTTLLQKRPIWFLSRKLLDRIDNRPGRLYSFIAERG